MTEPTDEYGRLELHYQASEGDIEALIESIATGGDVNLQDRNGWSPLHFAAQAYSQEAISALIEAGASVDVQDDYGNTPLWRAVFNCKDRDGMVIELLRQAGADPYLKNEAGVSPLSLAETIGNFNVAQYFSDLNGLSPHENT